MQYGRSLRALWELAPDAVFLNHGSFGACPKVVLAEQDRIRREMEAEPDRFFRDGILPRDGPSALRAALAEVGAFVNARENQLAFIENATVGMQAVLRSIDFRSGHRILTTDHGYNAVRLMVEARCKETGASPLVVSLPLPADADTIVARISEAITPDVRLAIVDHITSPTALVFPLDRLIRLFHERGVRVMVDGAHAIGQVPIDLAALQPDWYVSNLHKWLFAPKGTAFLHAADAVAPATRPNVVSHYVEMGFPRAFDFTGTRDNSSWLCAPAALRFNESLEPREARAYHARLLHAATEILAPLEPAGPMEMSASMRSFALPQSRAAKATDAPDFMRAYWEHERIQTQAVVLREKLLLRVSAQVYVEEDDLRTLRAALDRRGWPGR